MLEFHELINLYLQSFFGEAELTNKVFKIVLLENNADDANVIIKELKKSDDIFDFILVSDKESYRNALINHQPDLILAEAVIDGMEINEAIDTCRQLSPSSSIILLTMSLDRKLSVEELLKDPQSFINGQRLTKLNAVIKTSIDIIKSTEEINRMHRELKEREALLSATLESTADGILVVNNEGKIVSYNQNFIKMWGIPEKIMQIGEDNQALAFVLMQLKDPDKFLNRVHELYSDTDAESFDMVYFKDGRVFERYSKPQKIENKTVGRVWSFRDISAAKIKDDQLQASLREKEMMLREIHHRVKNNLQIISSLLNMQSQYIKDPNSVEHFRISQNRVRTMAMIHEKLYGSKDLSKIEFGPFFKQLSTHIFNSYGIPPNTIKLNVIADDVFLDIDTAVPCGLLINEIISNSLKHAFPDQSAGNIEIEMNKDKDGFYILNISDNGIGLPDGVHPSNSNSLGLKLINTLSKQLGSEMKLETNHGTRYHLKFTPLLYTERK